MAELPELEKLISNLLRIIGDVEEFCHTTIQDWGSSSELEAVLDCINREGEWTE